jgi:hypothetical protein
VTEIQVEEEKAKIVEIRKTKVCKMEEATPSRMSVSMYQSTIQGASEIW